MVIGDIGAAGGYNRMWRLLNDQHKVIGFEPHEESFKKLQADDTCEYFNIALGKSREPITVFLQNWRWASGSYRPDDSFWKRFPNAEMMNSHREESFIPIPLDDFRRENKVRSFDYLKLDTEGSELEILMGSKETLSECLAVEVEVTFYETHKGRPLFSEIEMYMREIGFYLYDIDTYRHQRSSLPPIEKVYSQPSSVGQMLWGDALFMRDMIGSPSSLKRISERLSSDKILKMICLYELFNQLDSAVELLERAVDENILPDFFRSWLDLLVPVTLGRALSLSEYREIFNSLPVPRDGD